MNTNSKQSKCTWSRVTMAALVASAMSITAATAFAGACPEDKRVPDGQGQKRSDAAAKDVTDKVIASTDLSKEPVGVKDHLFRARRLEIKPNGIVPWHSHDKRPAMIYIVKGTVTEYASSCAVPIMHKAGEIAPEKSGTSHWWKNSGKDTAVLISVDIFPVEDKKNEKMM